MVEWSIQIPRLPDKPIPASVDVYRFIQFVRLMRNCSLEEASGIAFPATFTSSHCSNLASPSHSCIRMRNMQHPDTPNIIIDNVGSWLCLAVMLYAGWALWGWLAVFIIATFFLLTASFSTSHYRSKIYELFRR